jgi:hypothetical protein
LDSALCDAAVCGILRSAFLIARDRRVDGFRRRRPCPAAEARSALRRVLADAVPFFGGRSFTPARRAFDNPIAIACFVDSAPCFPSRM